MKKTMVELARVSKVYPPDVTAIEDISLSVPKGEMFFLTGRSGAGKTTLLKLICGVEKPNKGLVEINGIDLSKIKPGQVPSLRQQIGMAYQDFKLLADRTVARNIDMAMEVCYMNTKAIRQRTRELLQKLQLEHKHDSLADNLSRGEQQRVAIARAVANSPTLILADEPTGNLDPATTELVLDLFEEQNRKGATIIIATHDHSIYRNTSHQVVELSAGHFSGIYLSGEETV